MASKRRKRAVTIAAQSKAATVSAERSWLWMWLFGAGITIAGVVYSPAFSGPFLFDDGGLPFSNPNADKMPLAFWFGGVRPVLMATYWLNYQISGIRTSSYHAFNLILHAATSVVVFFVLQRLIKLAGMEGKTFPISLFGAALFLLHPLQSESVAYVAGRSELVSGLFLLSAWLVFLNHFESRTTLTTALKILLLAGAAVLGKESAISLPGVLLITDCYWNRASLKDQIRNRLNLYAPMVFGGALAAIAIVHSLRNSTDAGLSIEGVTPFRYGLTQCHVILIYIRLFLIPVGQNGDWQIPFYRSLGDGGAWLYVLGILFLLSAITLSYRRSPLLSFGLAIFLVLLLPTSSILPIKDALAERRMYVPIIGLILASVAIVQRFQLDSAMLRTCAMGALIFAAILTFRMSRMWGDDIVFWKNVIKENPTSRRGRIGLGVTYARHGKFQDAVGEYDAIDREYGVTEETILNRVSAYEMMRNFDLALDVLHKFAAVHPTSSAYKNIGHLEAYTGHIKESIAAYTLALTLDPKDAPAYAERGMVYLESGDGERARADFQSALNIEPANDTAMSGLSRLAVLH